MLNKLLSFCAQQELIQPGDRVICAVSGGADSMALLWAMYLCKEKLQIQLEAAHFNHGLRGAESDGEEAFVRQFCARYQIPLHVGSARVTAGEKGLEAAARDARYAYFATLSGKIATAHTANDNAETVLMHLIRGTGLKGLGAISPARGNVIRPMLTLTRQQVLEFLEEYHIDHVEDSSNGQDRFLRNRIRHKVMPLLEQENPRIAENLSAMALRLREDEQVLSDMGQACAGVRQLRQMAPAVRRRSLCSLLEEFGVKEPQAQHIALLESVVFSDNPSAQASFPGGVCIGRNYDRLEKREETESFSVVLRCPGETVLPRLGIKVVCSPADTGCLQYDAFTVAVGENPVVRSRLPGDVIRLKGGTKKLKEVFVDRKIPAAQRMQIPVIADDTGVLGVYGLGANLDRVTLAGGMQIRFEKIEP